jgi:high frequency lysogenization protein
MFSAINSPSVLALAGVCQSAMLVKKLARQGEVTKPFFTASVESISVLDADSTEAVFGGLANLSLGLQGIVDQLNKTNQDKHAETMRYIANLITLERKLSGQNSTMNQLKERIIELQRQLAHFELFSGQMMENVASIYTDLISPLPPRIKVSGDKSILQQPVNQHKVRALLLAGIRSAVLWRQLGGKRRQIVLRRQQLVGIANEYLSRITE